MRRFLVLLVLLAVAVVTFSSVASPQENAQTFSICLPDRSGYEKSVDVGAKGFSSGDYSIFQDPILDRESGELIGHSFGRSTIVKVTKGDATFILETTFHIPARGKVVTYDATRFSRLDKGKAEAVIGGTGEFANARGTASTTEGRCAPGKSGARIRFELILE
jgi:hypothetical protein